MYEWFFSSSETEFDKYIRVPYLSICKVIFLMQLKNWGGVYL